MYDIFGEKSVVSPVKTSENLFEELDFGFLGKMANNVLLKKYLTQDKYIILQRQAVFKTLCENTEFADFLENLLEKLENLIALKSNNKKYMLRESGNNERAFSEFRELLLFTECVDTVLQGKDKFANINLSTGFAEMFERTEGIAESIWYKNAKIYIERVAEELKNIKSVCLGVNLDASLCVKEFGLVSLNSEYYKTNSFFDKMFAKNVGNKEYICIAPISGEASSYTGYSLDVFNSGLYKAISAVLGGTVRKMRKRLYDILCDNTAFLTGYYADIKFISASYRYILSMKACGLPLCFPEISEEYAIEGIYNPNFAGNIKSRDIVKNDFSFDENGQIYILTGANSGGKTAFLRSVGISQVLFQLGLPIAAKSAKMQIFSNIFSHFSSQIRDINGGRFENECKAIMNFYKDITSDSLLLLDEMFSTTSSFEGTIVATHMLERFAKIGCKCIYTTHMHDLAYKIDELNAKKGIRSRLDSLSAQVLGEFCTYKILRKRETYGSLAEAICRKYGFAD
ncbi:MAG: hypothetical protein IJX55_01545 [Clostridia bacterium]|nr:hypothetical protein [Clostridia bacterium]